MIPDKARQREMSTNNVDVEYNKVGCVCRQGRR